MRALALASTLFLTGMCLPAEAQTSPQRTQSATKRTPAPPGFNDAFEQQDYEKAFISIAEAVIACVKARTVEDECLDLLLIATTTATRAKALEPAETLAVEAARIAETALPETDTDRLIAARNLAAVLDQAGKTNEALVWHRKALALADRQLPPGAAETGAEIKAIAAALGDSKDLAARETIERRLLAWRELSEPQNIATSHADLASLLKSQGRFTEAEAAYAEAYRRFAVQLGKDHPYTLTALRGRIESLESLGKQRDALPLLKELATASPLDALVIRWLGRLQLDLGDYPASEASYRRAVELLRADPKADQVILADSIAGVAVALDARDRSAEAEAMLREALAMLPPQGQEDRERRLLNNLAGAIMSQGRFVEAERIYRHLATDRDNAPPLDRAIALSNLSVALSYQNRLDEAAEVQREATKLRRANLPADDKMIAMSESILAGIEEDRKGYPAAIALRRSAYASYRKTLGPEHPLTASAAQNLALALAHTRTDIAQMDALLREARGVMAKLDPDSYERIVNAGYLAVAIMSDRQRPDPREARLLLRESVGGIHARVARFRDFGPAAQAEMRTYGPIFSRQVQAAWALASGAR